MKFWRVNLIFILFFLFGAAIIGRLVHLQIIQGEKYRVWAEGRLFLREGILPGERGEIFLKNGESLAINKNFDTAYISPPKVKEPEKTAAVLSRILGMGSDFILEKLRKEALSLPIKNRLTLKEVEELKNAELPGVYTDKEKGRYFPQEGLASQAVGFLDADFQGQYGLEGYYNEILSGRDGEKGTDLKLNIDYNIQFFSEKLLEKAKESLSIESGLILVLDPFSGKVLTLANFPNFNPNQYKQYAKAHGLDIFQNSATQKIFEPGSVFKPITIAAGLEEGKITPKTIYTDEGMVRVGGYKVLNYDNRVYGLQTITNVLEKSINTGAVFAENKLGHNLFLRYIEKFGFFDKTGIDLAETYSENKELKKGYEINFTTASFGQGIEITPIQLARAFSVIANGGQLVRPHLAENIEIKDESDQFPVISQKTASQLTAMLVSVVENGFGRGARIPGYYIAGKTGTAQVPEKGAYSSDKTIQSFVGFFPAFEPQFLVLVKLDNPETKTAEYSAVPIFRDIAEYIVNLYQIPPDYE